MYKETIMPAGAFGIGEWGKSYGMPIYVGEDSDVSKGPVVSVIASKSHPGVYYTATDRGQLTAQTVRFSKCAEMDYKFKYDPTVNPLASQVEQHAYCRCIREAEEALDKLESLQQTTNEEHLCDKDMVALRNSVKPMSPITPEMWEIDSVPDLKSAAAQLWTNSDKWDFSITTFKNDLDYWGKHLAPGYNICFNLPLDLSDIFRGKVDQKIENTSQRDQSESSSAETKDDNMSIKTPEEESSEELFEDNTSNLSRAYTVNTNTSERSRPTRSNSVRSNIGQSFRRNSRTSNSLESTPSILRNANPLKSLKRVFSRTKPHGTPSIERKNSSEEPMPSPTSPLERKPTLRRNAILGSF
ncbi:hypothetical protein CLU79DRAFT_84608 [Phycomyces nitens]|nr:hypothetical protein CLU79DRAFT_84608 [Phycomyces nitens]